MSQILLYHKIKVRVQYCRIGPTEKTKNDYEAKR